MRTEKEIRERLKEVEAVIEILNKWGCYDPIFIAFHTVLEWVLQDSGAP